MKLLLENVIIFNIYNIVVNITVHNIIILHYIISRLDNSIGRVLGTFKEKSMRYPETSDYQNKTNIEKI